MALNPSDSGTHYSRVLNRQSKTADLVAEALSSGISVLKRVPRCSGGPAWVEDNRQNKPAFGELTGWRALGGGLGPKWAAISPPAHPQRRTATKRNSHWTGARGTSQLSQSTQ